MKHLVIAALITLAAAAYTQHTVITVGKGTLVKYDRDQKLVWEMLWPGGTHDLHLLSSGHILAIRDAHVISEIDPDKKEVVWSYDSARENGNEGKHIEVHAIQPLPEDRIMIAESGAARIIEIDREGKLLKTVPLKVDNPNPHRDTRLARKLDTGNYLVCHEGDGVIREYDGASSEVVWEYPVPLFGKARADGHGPEAFGNQAFSALRGPEGTTLIGTGNGHSVIEVTTEKEIVGELHQNDLPGITLAWITNVHLLPNGHLIIGNCHAGPGQPQLVEVDPRSKTVVWTFEHFDELGNDVTNSVLVD